MVVSILLTVKLKPPMRVFRWRFWSGNNVKININVRGTALW